MDKNDHRLIKVHGCHAQKLDEAHCGSVIGSIGWKNLEHSIFIHNVIGTKFHHLVKR